MRLDDGHVAIFVGCEYPIDNKESTVREFNDSRAAVPDDVVVGNDLAIFANEKAAALSERMTILMPLGIWPGYLDRLPCSCSGRSVPTSRPPATERLPCTSSRSLLAGGADLRSPSLNSIRESRADQLTQGLSKYDFGYLQ